jgi:hypothetical protein
MAFKKDGFGAGSWSGFGIRHPPDRKWAAGPVYAAQASKANLAGKSSAFSSLRASC